MATVATMVTMRAIHRYGRRIYGTAAVPLILAALLQGTACQRAPGEATGTVTFRGQGMEGVTVEIYLQEKKTEGGAAFMTAATAMGGEFTLSLPPGEYWFWAKESAPAFGPRKIAEYPLNPVKVAAGAELRLEPLELQPVGAGGERAVDPGTGVTGSVFDEGGPVADAVIMIYPGDRERLMGPGYAATVRSDDKGIYFVDLAAGTYQVAARKRQDGGMAGFLRAGDLTGEYAGNPVTVSPGKYFDIGTVVLHPVSAERLTGEQASRFQTPTGTRLEGMVVDQAGKPLEGQFVFVYRDEGMIGRPDFLTTSDEKGAFIFNLGAGGKFYLGARDRFGGPRQPGDVVGRLDGSTDSSVEAGNGEVLEKLQITMEEMW